MGFEITKAEFQELARNKLADAELLLREQRWSSAYYLSGYAVELAFKACITKVFKAETLPDNDVVVATYTHSLGKLAEQAGLKAAIEQERLAFRVHWAIAQVWVPESRYKMFDEVTATAIVAAVSDTNNGVLPWISAHW